MLVTPYASGDTMWAGQALRRQSLTSPAGGFVLVHQDDGNLVLYDQHSGHALWASCTDGTSAGRCVLQKDGNLVVYDADGEALWASGTDGSPVRRLVVRDDGDVVLLDIDGVERWSTGTGRASSPREDVPRTAEEWRAFLTSYSADYLRVADEGELDQLEAGQVESGWLGTAGAGEDALAALEERLGRRLPPSLHAFLRVSDGWTNPSPFMYSMRTTATIGWMVDAQPDFAYVFPSEDDLSDVVARSLLIADDGDATTWFLDPEDVSEDGEWAAYSWSSWSPEGERSHSFAELVVSERASFEHLSAHNGRPVHTEGVDELIAMARQHAARGDVDAAIDALGHAVGKGSALAAYLRALLCAFLDLPGTADRIRGSVFGPVQRGEIDMTHVHAELLPLYLCSARSDPHGRIDWYLRAADFMLPAANGDDGDLRARAATFVPPVLPESPVFQAALDMARELAVARDYGRAWETIEAALPEWRSDSPFRIAPVVLLTDPVLRGVVTTDRFERVVTTPRKYGAGPI